MSTEGVGNPAYDQGYDVGYHSNKPLIDCMAMNPYILGTTNFKLWETGCQHGFTDWFVE